MIISITFLKIHFYKYITFSFKEFPGNRNPPPKSILPGTAEFKKDVLHF